MAFALTKASFIRVFDVKSDAATSGMQNCFSIGGFSEEKLSFLC